MAQCTNAQPLLNIIKSDSVSSLGQLKPLSDTPCSGTLCCCLGHVCVCMHACMDAVSDHDCDVTVVLV